MFYGVLVDISPSIAEHRSDHHDERGPRRMEIRKHRIDDRELISRSDEEFCFRVELSNLSSSDGC